MGTGQTIMANSMSSRHNSPLCRPMTILGSSHFCKYTKIGGPGRFGVSWALFTKMPVGFRESGMIHRKTDDRELVNSFWSVVAKASQSCRVRVC